MHKRGGFVVAILGAALALAACGGTDTCQHGVDAYKAVQDKIGTCQLQASAFDKQTCDSGVKACTNQEKDAVNKYFDCLQNLQACQAGGENAFMAAYDTCQQNAGTISSACFTGVFGG